MTRFSHLKCHFITEKIIHMYSELDVRDKLIQKEYIIILQQKVLVKILFSGQPLDVAPMYAFAKEYNNSCQTVDVQYSFFYPFNYGKVGIFFGEKEY